VGYCPEGREIVTPDIRNTGRRRRLAASFAAVAIVGTALVTVTRFLPRLMERRQVERLKVQNEELRRQLEAFREPALRLPWEKNPSTREITDPEIRRRLILTKPAEKIIVVPLSTERPQIGERLMTDPPDPSDGYKNARIDHNGRMKMPADRNRVLQWHLGYPTPAKPTTKHRRQAAGDSSPPKTAR
jgi:hypothetical protein